MTTTNRRHSISRRDLMAGAAGLVGASVLCTFVPRHARAAGSMVLGTWGGDYARLLSENVEQPLLEPQDVQVVHDINGDPERRAKLLAERRLPRGTTDLQALSAAGSYEMWAQDVLQPVNYDQIPNASNLLDKMSTEYAVGHIYSGKVILYNPDLVDPPPTRFADLWNPTYQGKVGIIDIQYQFTLLAAALGAGGGVADFEPGKEKLLEFRDMGMKMYPTNEAMAQALQVGEVGLCIMWKARAVQWQNAGVPVVAVGAEEGVPLYVSDFCVPKNAPNPELAHVYLNTMLDASAQERFAETMGYNPTVSNAKIPPETQERIGFTKEEQERLLQPDYRYFAEHDSELKEWWDKVFKA
jgi:putative spermidine/putrescine transport system substrate-binding protein